MALAGEMKDIVDRIVSSYEARIQNIGNLFDATHQILLNVQGSLFDARQEREKLNTELRESLAKNRSLRRRDFDRMMQGIILAQEDREQEVKDLLNSYLSEQKKRTENLRESLKEFKGCLEKGEAQRVKEFQKLIKGILAKQEERKDQVTSRLKELRKEQKVLASRFKELLAKGRELRIKDLKAMLEEFKTRSSGGLTRQQEREKEVRQLLDDYKQRQGPIIRMTPQGMRAN